MGKIHTKALQDLEFDTVLQQLSVRCNTELGKERALGIAPLLSTESIHRELGQTSEYVSSLISDNRIPNHGFDTIDGDLKLLKIENTTLEISGFRRIASICKTIAAHKKFFKKFKEYFPLLFEATEVIQLNAEIPKHINGVIDRFGEIKDNASDKLLNIRQDINKVKGKINQSFASALNTYKTSDYLDDIKESVVDNRRVLAVKAMYRKKVKGTVMGSSKTGSIVYIEPEASLRYSRQLNNLEFDEREEIQRILNDLTNSIRPFAPFLAEYQDFLVHMDITAAKAKYASEMNAILPKINEDQQMLLKDAYHPLLYLSNRLMDR
ncbi:MAG: DNA mismatch repair protein MutS, partial [Maribacter sp.]|nr:DNA mismatch repair protein MutS [Maribacter sp.]